MMVFFLSAYGAAHSSERHALVIGNSNYGSGFSLVNPLHDSTAIAAKLSSIGYTVHRGSALLDLGLVEFNNEIDSFLSKLDDGANTLIYYAGHGSSTGGDNFLIPILPQGVTLRTDSDIRNHSISLHGLLERVGQHNPTGTNVLFIDACRDAPVDNITRSINLTGLTSIDTRRQPRGSFVGFSTEYGKLALDDNDRGNSPFASAILRNLDTHASAPIELFYKSISQDVYDQTSGHQFPIQESKIRGDHCIVTCDDSALQKESSPQEFGFLTIVTNPLDAEVCSLVANEWTAWNCGKQLILPLNKPVELKVTANGHSDYSVRTTLREPKQQLVIKLEPKEARSYKLVGAVAAIVLTGLLLSRGGSDDSQPQQTYQLTLNPP